jgi:hypothetical protein
MWRSTALALVALALAPAGAGAAAARVESMVVMRDGTAHGPRTVRAAATRVRRCRVAQGTPLAALAAFDRAGGPSFRATGACSALYVRQIGRDRARGRAGWVYKVGHRLGTAAAGDPSGPFGNGRLRSGRRLLWFWCVAAARCQRTLAVSGAGPRLSAGRRLRLTVRGHDDHGRAVRVAGATVALGRTRARTGADGTATLTVPARAGRYRLRAARRGMVPAFPRVVSVR